ncbi:MAG: aminotransferase class I/II-fold pyridoxal phosphate-dependent enzyme [Anaerovoracaceae bacterium]|jgi:aromatic-amino-acid transaminase
MEYVFAEGNGRVISGKDKIFGISTLAKEAVKRDGKENVTNATIGALIDDNGELIVLSSMVEVLKDMKPAEFAEYAPIAGVPEYLEILPRAAFGDYRPDGYIEGCATPGGTGTIRNTISCYSKYGDAVLTSNWFWSPYNIIATEIGRRIETYEMFDENEHFNLKGFEEKIRELLAKQDSLVIIFNAPAHNPTGYTPSDEEWDEIVAILKRCGAGGKKITMLLDIAYIDFSGDSKTSRSFLPKFGNMPDNILVVAGFSASKGFTFYGLRTGGMLCITQNKAIAEEFKRVTSFASRGSWSNCVRVGQLALAKVFNDETLLKKVFDERKVYEDMLASRCAAFRDSAAAAGLKTCPFKGGFFVTVPCANDDAVNEELFKDNIFGVAIGGGIRIAISAISEEKCRMVPGKIAAAIKKVNG